MSDEVQDAMGRARTHLNAALRESLEAIRALTDAAQAAAGTSASVGGDLAQNLKSALDHWIENAEQGRGFAMPQAFAEPIERALQAEIARWEARSASDETARPILRAFLGLRELLWEMGMRSDAKGGDEKRGDANGGGAADDRERGDSATAERTPAENGHTGNSGAASRHSEGDAAEHRSAEADLGEAGAGNGGLEPRESTGSGGARAAATTPSGNEPKIPDAPGSRTGPRVQRFTLED